MGRLKDELTHERIRTEFWISPTGKIRRWAGTVTEASEWASLHSAIAQKILGHIPEVASGMKDGCDILHKTGWIAMGSACYGNRIDREPTQAQINTLDELGFNRIQEMSGIVHEW